MARGVNRAYPRDRFESNLVHVKSGCIFISHKYEDLKAAQRVAEYIMQYGFDVYLDDHDLKLKKAVDMNDSQGIVACIEDGLNTSTHILVLVTEHTRMSWWVPYETGYAKRGKKNIASLLLRKANEFPDYLKIETTLKGFRELTGYLDNLPILTPIMESTLSKDERIFVQNQNRRALLEYIRE